MKEQSLEDTWVDREGMLSFAANQAHLKTLKICLTGAVALVILMAGAASFALSRPPRIALIRVDEVRGAELVKTPEAGLDIRAGEVRMALWHWCTWRYRIVKSIGKQDFAQSYYFLSSRLMSALRQGDADRVAAVIAGSSPEQTVDVRSIALPPLQREKSGTKSILAGRAQIELITSEDLTGQLGSQDSTRKHWRIDIEYIVDPTEAAKRGLDDPEYEIINPLGITITACYETREPRFPLVDLKTMLAFFQPAELREVVASPDYSDVMINADGRVFAEQGGVVRRLPFLAGPTNVAIQNAARTLGKDFTRERPILDARLPDGSRVAAVMNQDGSSFITIRKFARWYSSDELIERGALTVEVREVLVDGLCGAGKDAANIIFSGGTSSGKSTQVKALIDHIQPEHRLIVIEKPRELEIKHQNVVQWEAEDAVEGEIPARSVGQLLAAALRHRPDHIIIGEVREPEAAYQMLQAMNTGHSGTLSTIHADSAEDALERMADLALAAHSNLSAEFVRRQVYRTISYVCHVSRRPDGSRGVRELVKASSNGKVEYLFGGEKQWPIN